MKEFEVGERVTLEVTETDKESCKGCFFDSKKFCEIWQLYPCCNQGHYKTNVFLDNLWYRFVGNNHEIFISKQYRDYINVLIKLGFKQLYYKSFKEKEITKYECN